MHGSWFLITPNPKYVAMREHAWALMSQPSVDCSNVQAATVGSSYIWSIHEGPFKRKWLNLWQHSGAWTWAAWCSEGFLIQREGVFFYQYVEENSGENALRHFHVELWRIRHWKKVKSDKQNTASLEVGRTKLAWSQRVDFYQFTCTVLNQRELVRDMCWIIVCQF